MMTDSDTRFDSPSHAGNALRVMESFFRSQQLTDVILIAGNKRIAAHRLVLSASSDYFAAMFMSSMKETVENEIRLEKIDGDALLALVQFCYNGSIELREDNVETLFVTACQLQINPVVRACTLFLIRRLDPSNCVGIRKFAYTQGCDYLASAANTYILDNFVEVANNQEFLSLSTDEVTELLKSEDVNVPSEEAIFNILMTWLIHDIENRKKHASMLLSYVKLPLLTPRFITDNIQTNELFRDQKAVQDLILEAFTYHLLQERTESLLQSGRTKPRKSTMDVLLSLGESEGADSFLTIEAFFLRDNVWKNLTETSARGKTFGAVFFENELYVVGGIHNEDESSLNNVNSFDFSTGLWKPRPFLKEPRNGAGTAVLGGFLYVFGGYGNGELLNTVERWKPAFRKWSYVAPMLTGRCDTGVAVVNNKLYVVGGWNGENELNTVECYDPHKNEWTSCSPMFEARDTVGLGVLNGCIYVTGGPCTGTAIQLNSVERYDPKTDTWTMMAPMNVARRNAGVGVLGDQLFVVGGIGDDGCLTAVEAYDPAVNKWQEFAPLKVGKAGPCVVVNRSLCKF